MIDTTCRQPVPLPRVMRCKPFESAAAELVDESWEPQSTSADADASPIASVFAERLLRPPPSEAA